MIGLIANGAWKYIAAAAALLVLCAATYFKGRADGASVVQAEYDGYRLTQAANLHKAYEQSRYIEQEANKRITAIKERERETLHSADLKHRAALERLRQQTSGSGSAGVSDSPAARLASCTEPAVAGGDGVVVAGAEDLRFPLDYAADVAKLQTALDSCVSQYETIMEAINGKH